MLPFVLEVVTIVPGRRRWAAGKTGQPPIRRAGSPAAAALSKLVYAGLVRRPCWDRSAGRGTPSRVRATPATSPGPVPGAREGAVAYARRRRYFHDGSRDAGQWREPRRGAAIGGFRGSSPRASVRASRRASSSPGYWPRWSAEFEAERPRLQVRLEASPQALASFPEVFGPAAGPALEAAAPPGEDGWRVVTLSFEHERAAVHRLAGFGNQVGVLDPPSVRAMFPGSDFEAVQAVSKEHGMEGVVAKRLDSRYTPGVRTGNWRKIKNVHTQEAVIASYKPGQGNRTGQVGSLLIGVNDASGLIYAGHVGTGFSDETLRMLGVGLPRLRAPADSPPCQP